MGRKRRKSGPSREPFAPPPCSSQERDLRELASRESERGAASGALRLRTLTAVRPYRAGSRTTFAEKGRATRSIDIAGPARRRFT